MLKAKYASPLDDKNFVNHGVKEIGSYTYVLLIDMVGQTIIKRVKTDNTEILFAKKSSGAIADFWADPTVHIYKYLYLV